MAAQLRSSENRLGAGLEKTSLVNDTTACNFACRHDPHFRRRFFERPILATQELALAMGRDSNLSLAKPLTVALLCFERFGGAFFGNEPVSACPGGHFALAAGSGRDGIANARREMR